MAVKTPTLDDLAHIAASYSLSLTPQDLESFRGLMAGMLASYARLDELTEPTVPVKYPRSPGFRPQPEDNPLGAWYWRTELKGAPSGPLAGKTVAIKDNVCVAGVPMMNGSSVLEGYVPEIDATIVTRILDAGGTILGKAVCENLCFSGGSHTSATGPVRNPHDPSRSAGGSSSGSAALVAAGEVDLAIGGDQGGSIRMPSCWCGIYGLKPTYGLVPYTGIFPIELTLDHTGPMARTVADVALLLEVIAGPDGLDPRQRVDLKGEAYARALPGDVRGLRLGIVQEGFGWEANDLSETVKLVMLLGRYMQDHYHGRYYAKAQNLARSLTAAYDAALRNCDLLVMPTLPLKATPIPPAGASREEYTDRALQMLPNTCPFDVTGHPALNVPCGMSGGLPVGMMLIGRIGDDATVLRAADAFQRQIFAAPTPGKK